MEKFLKNFKFPEGTSEESKTLVYEMLKHADENAREQIKEMIEKSVNTDELTKQINSLKETLKEQGAELGRIKGAGAVKNMSAKEEFFKAVQDEGFIANIKAGRSQEVHIKAVGSILNSGNATAVSTVSNTIIPEVQSEPRYPDTLLAAVLKGSVSSETITWVNQKSKDGSPAFTAEGSALPQVDFQWVVETSQAKKIGSYTKVSMEMLHDAGMLANTIGALQVDLINQVVESALVSGSGTGANISGAKTLGVGFTMTGLDGRYISPTMIHAIYAVITQMRNGGFNPTKCYVHPTDKAFIDTMQDTIGRFMSDEALAVLSPVEVVGCASITEGEFIVIDPNVWMCQSLEGLSIEFGFDGNDFTLDLMTVKVRMRLHSYVSDVKKNGIVYGDFDTIIAGLTAEVEEVEE